MNDQCGQCDSELMGAYLSRCSPWAGCGVGLPLKAHTEPGPQADPCDHPCLSQAQLELWQTDHCGWSLCPRVTGHLTGRVSARGAHCVRCFEALTAHHRPSLLGVQGRPKPLNSPSLTLMRNLHVGDLRSSPLPHNYSRPTFAAPCPVEILSLWHLVCLSLLSPKSGTLT